jgi:multicomponent Na+:H+ antiporter subunit B
MSLGARRRLLLSSLIGLALMLGWGVYGLPDFGQHLGHYAAMLNELAVPERHVTNVVTAVNFDYRALDTMGEEFILFAAVVGVALLLRAQRVEREQQADDEAPGREVPEASDAVRVTGLGLIGFTILLGFYIVLHGQLTPGGGFQGGVILATALLLVYLAGEHALFQRFTPMAVIHAAESMGVGGYVAIGMGGVLIGTSFLRNMMPLGQTGRIYAGGMIPLVNLAVALAVTAGLVLLLADFIEQSLVLRLRRKR